MIRRPDAQAHLALLPARDARVLRAVAAAYLVDPAELVRPNRTPEVVEARWLAMALLMRAGRSRGQVARILRHDWDTVRYGLAQAHRLHAPTLERLARDLAG